MIYKGLVSSDWNECLAPTGPFDPVAFIYPDLKKELDTIFKNYTSNQIPLSKAVSQIVGLLPKPFSIDQMDAYLERSFAIYNGVSEMIDLLASKNILFMINTTGALGFFQRIIAKKLIPAVPIIASNPFIQFPGAQTDPRFDYLVSEISDKGRNTATVIRKHGLLSSRVFLIGDSGGDGPHFSWGSSNGAYLIGSMTKASLSKYCDTNKISINKFFGVIYSENEPRDYEREYEFNFKELGLYILDMIN
ncbi:MAG: hypothetical protein PHS86_00190 [Syntrophaceae bacterium]|nr:hypothetical protein [Syntrophaceae bacterium]